MRPTLPSAPARPALPYRELLAPAPPAPVWPWPAKLAVAAGLAVLFLALVWQPELVLTLMLLLGLGVPALAVAWFYPELGIVALVFLGSRILDPRLVEIRLPFGGGIELPDLALIGLAGLSLLRQVQRRGLHLPRSWVVPPLIAWLWVALLSAGIALLLNGVEASWALSELRGIAYYGVFFLVTWDVRRVDQLQRLLAGLFAIGLLVTGVMLIQQFVGPVPLFSGQDATTWQIIGQGSGVTRIRPPAHVLLYYLSILSFVLVAFVRNPATKLVSFGLAVFLNLALLLTFTRSQWVASVLALGLAFFLFPPGARKALLALGAVLAVVGALVVVSQRNEFNSLVREQNFATPLVERVESLFTLDETLNSYSAQTRYMQTDAALDSIRENPVLGVGLGNAYRGLTPQEAVSRYTRFTRFIENSYLYMTTKMGIPALLIFVWLAAAVLWSAWRSYGQVSDPLLKGVSLAGLASFTGLVVWAFNHPLLMLAEYTIMVGLIAGLSAVTGLIHLESSHESPV